MKEKVVDIVILGGDERSFFLGKMLMHKSKEIKEIGEVLDYGNPRSECSLSIDEVLGRTERSHVIILPVPYTTDGIYLKWGNCNCKPISLECLQEVLHEGQIVFGSNMKADFVRQLQEKSVEVFDFMKDDMVAKKNAVATAEGTIAEAIGLMQGNLESSNSLVLGYGKCGSVIAKKLASLGSKVSVMVRNEMVRKQCEADGFNGIPMFIEQAQRNGSFDLVVNTIPSMVLDKKALEQIGSDAIIIDIASKPGGTDFDSASQMGIIAKHCLGLPGKYAPKASGEILADYILKNLF